jgi:hypothetical protein
MMTRTKTQLTVDRPVTSAPQIFFQRRRELGTAPLVASAGLSVADAFHIGASARSDFLCSLDGLFLGIRDGAGSVGTFSLDGVFAIATAFNENLRWATRYLDTGSLFEDGTSRQKAIARDPFTCEFRHVKNILRIDPIV